LRAGTVRSSPWPPHRCSPTIWNPGCIGASSPWATTISMGETAGLTTTSSPTPIPVTPEPTDSTTPATSQPGTWGSFGRGLPFVTHRSMWLRALATGRTRTSSGPTAGSGTSPKR
jgi:hypothetical protein